MLVAVENDSSQNPVLAIDEDKLLNGVEDEEIEMPEVIVGDQGNTFIQTIAYLLI